MWIQQALWRLSCQRLPGGLRDLLFALDVVWASFLQCTLGLYLTQTSRSLRTLQQEIFHHGKWQANLILLSNHYTGTGCQRAVAALSRKSKQEKLDSIILSPKYFMTFQNTLSLLCSILFRLNLDYFSGSHVTISSWNVPQALLLLHTWNRGDKMNLPAQHRF